MSSQFQGLVESGTGRVRFQIQGTVSRPPNAIDFRGFAITPQRTVLGVDAAAATNRVYPGGIAVERDTGLVLVSGNQIVNVVPGALGVDAEGVLVVTSAQPPVVIHQGVGFNAEGALTIITLTDPTCQFPVPGNVIQNPNKITSEAGWSIGANTTTTHDEQQDATRIEMIVGSQTSASQVIAKGPTYDASLWYKIGPGGTSDALRFGITDGVVIVPGPDLVPKNYWQCATVKGVNTSGFTIDARFNIDGKNTAPLDVMVKHCVAVAV